MTGESERRALKWPLRVRQDRRAGVLVVVLAGRLSHASAGLFRQTLDEAIERGERQVVLDFGAVDYLSSAGLMILHDANRRLHALRGALVLCGMVEPVRLVLELSGLLSQFALEVSHDSAVARAASPAATHELGDR